MVVNKKNSKAKVAVTAKNLIAGAEKHFGSRLQVVVMGNPQTTEQITSKLQALINVAESLTRALDIPQSPKNRLTHLNAAAVAALGIHWGSSEMLECFGRCRARYSQTSR